MLHRPARASVIVTIVVGIVAVALSAIGSANASLWGDEAASVMSAERPLASLFSMVQHVDAVHGLYYLGLHFWIQLFGASPFSVRFPSAIAVGVTASGLVVLGSRLRGLRLGVVAGLIGAVVPRLTDVGSEARSYAMTAAVATWLTVLLVVQLQAAAPRRRYWIAYGVVLAVGTALFIWVALIAAAHLVCMVFTRTRLRGMTPALSGWVGATTLALLAASPVLVTAFLERDQIAYLEQRQSYGVTAVFVTPWFESPAAAIVGWLLVIAGTVLGVRCAIRSQALRRAELLLPVIWMLLPTLFLLSFSAFIAVYTPRYLTMCAPAIALLIAIPIDALLGSRRRVEALITVGIVLAVIAPVWVAQRGPYAKNNSDWARISDELGARARPGDAVAFDDSVRPSRRTRLAMRTYPAGFAGLADPTLRTSFVHADTWYDGTYTLAQAIALGRLAHVHRVWLIEYALPGSTDSSGTATLETAGFRQVSAVRNHRSVVLEWVRP